MKKCPKVIPNCPAFFGHCERVLFVFNDIPASNPKFFIFPRLGGELSFLAIAIPSCRPFVLIKFPDSLIIFNGIGALFRVIIARPYAGELSYNLGPPFTERCPPWRLRSCAASPGRLIGSL